MRNLNSKKAQLVAKKIVILILFSFSKQILKTYQSLKKSFSYSAVHMKSYDIFHMHWKRFIIVEIL